MLSQRMAGAVLQDVCGLFSDLYCETSVFRRCWWDRVSNPLWFALVWDQSLSLAVPLGRQGRAHKMKWLQMDREFPEESIFWWLGSSHDREEQDPLLCGNQMTWKTLSATRAVSGMAICLQDSPWYYLLGKTGFSCYPGKRSSCVPCLVIPNTCICKCCLAVSELEGFCCMVSGKLPVEGWVLVCFTLRWYWRQKRKSVWRFIFLLPRYGLYRLGKKS